VDKNPITSGNDIEENKQVAALSYLSILFLVPLLTKRDSKYTQFHAKQGLVLCVAEVVSIVVIWIPPLYGILWIAFLILSVMGIVKALAGEWWELPILGKYAKKFNI